MRRAKLERGGLWLGMLEFERGLLSTLKYFEVLGSRRAGNRGREGRSWTCIKSLPIQITKSVQVLIGLVDHIDGSCTSIVGATCKPDLGLGRIPAMRTKTGAYLHANDKSAAVRQDS